jgi:hypothetical protein
MDRNAALPSTTSTLEVVSAAQIQPTCASHGVGPPMDNIGLRADIASPTRFGDSWRSVWPSGRGVMPGRSGDEGQ